MTKEEMIVNSDAFRAINVQIAEKTAYLIWCVSNVKFRANHAFDGAQYKTRIPSQISYESGGRKKGEIELECDLVGLKDVATSIEECLQLEKEVRELQRFKLRLVGDWDFTHGDTELQEKVFPNLPKE